MQPNRHGHAQLTVNKKRIDFITLLILKIYITQNHRDRNSTTY